MKLLLHILLLAFLTPAFGQDWDSKLLDATRKNDISAVAKAIKSSADINAADENGASALMWAVYKADLPIVKLLVENGADEKKKGVIYLDSLNQSYYGNLTGIAAGEGSLEKLKYLIEEVRVPINDRELNPETKKEDGWTAAQWTWSQKDTTLLQYLRSMGANLTNDYRAQILKLKDAEGWKNVNFRSSVYELARILEFVDEHYDEAAESYAMALAITIELEGKDAPNYQYILSNLVDCFVQGEKWESAEKAGQDLLEVNRKMFGEKSIEYLESLLGLAKVCLNSHNYDKSKALFVEGLKLRKAEVGKESVEYASSLETVALTYRRMGDYQGARQLLLEQEKIERKILGIIHPDYATTLNNLGMIEEEMGNLTAAMDYFIQSKRIRDKIGKRDAGYAMTLDNISSLMSLQGKYSEAVPLQIEILNLRKSLVGTKSPDYAMSLNNLSFSYSMLGKYKLAEPMLQEALDILTSVFESNPNNFTYAQYYNSCIGNLALLYRELGDFKKAAVYYSKSYELNLKFYGKDHPDFAGFLVLLSGFYNQAGNYERALQHGEEARDKLKLHLGENHPSYIESLGNLAFIHQAMGNYKVADEFFLEAMDRVSSQLGEEHPRLAFFLNGYGLSKYLQGDFSEAEKSFMRSIEMRESKNTTILPNEIGAYTNLGLLYQNLGNFEKAVAVMERVEKIIQDVFGSDHPMNSVVSNNLGLCYMAAGKYKLAEEAFLNSLRIVRLTYGSGHLSEAPILSNLSVISLLFDQPEKSVQFLDTAIAVVLSAVGESHPYMIRLVTNMAYSYEQMMEYDKAAELYQEAIALFKQSGVSETEQLISPMMGWGAVSRSAGKVAVADSLYHIATGHIFNTLSNRFSFLNEEERFLYFNDNDSQFNDLASFYYEHSSNVKDDGAVSYNLELSLKSVLLNSSIDFRSRISNSHDSQTLKEYDNWLEFRKLESSRISMDKSSNQAELDSVKIESEKLEKSLTRKLSGFASLNELGKVKWSNVQSRLSENEVAIEFSSFPYFRADGSLSDSTVYVALLLRNDLDYPIMVKLLEEKQLDSLFQHHDSSDRDMIANLYRGAIAVGENDKVSYGKRLYELLWEPLDSLLNEGDKVYFAPSGLMHRIALAAIPYDDKGTLLSDRYQLTRLSTTAKLLDKEEEQTKPKEIALFGGIDYEWKETAKVDPELEELSETFVSRALPTDLDRGNTSWTYLPGTLSETESIATLATNAGIKVKKYSSTEATEERMKSLGGKNSPTVLHIATHGFFFPDPERDRNENRMLQMMGEREQVYRYSDDPLNRAGLLFAGANSTWKGQEAPKDREDGILTANEATYIPLNNTELVVLSACETGLGEIKGSEGIFGLQRAFKAAGTKYVMMSLWKVPDQETSEFMTEFYTSYLNGASIPDSYHKAQKVMRNKYPQDPYKWAAFVLMR